MAKSSALPLLVGGAAALALASGKKKKKKKKSSGGGGKIRWGVRVTSDCQDVIIENDELFSDFILAGYQELHGIDPDLDVIEISTALFGEVAPDCSPFPEEPESGAIAELFAFVMRRVAFYMVADGRQQNIDLVEDSMGIAFNDWYTQWRNYPSSDIYDFPPSQVGFANDFSKYKIGPQWYSKTIKPFVATAVQQGRAGTAFEDYVANNRVLVGEFEKDIASLPQDQPVVDDYLDEVEEAIDRALSEINA